MKVLVIGLSPYLLTSRSKVSALIMRYLYVSGLEVCGAAWAHDTSYFVPDEEGHLFYEFDITGHGKHQIPLKSFSRGDHESVEIYEILDKTRPDMVITVGDYGDFAYMKAVKMFYSRPFKWLFVLMNYSNPINENNHELLNYADGVLCTSQFGFDTVRNLYDKEIIDVAYLGSNVKTFNLIDLPERCDKFRIMASGKCHQVDNLPVIMESVAEAHRVNPNIELYVHTNLHDRGDYDLELIKARFDPDDEFIRFPDKYVSLYEGVTDIELAQEMKLADMYISVPLVSATSMSVFDAISCGCYPMLSDCGSNRDVAGLLADCFEGYEAEDFLVPCVKLYSAASTYLNVCDPQQLAEKVVTVSERYKKDAGKSPYLEEFTNRHNREGFLAKLSQIIGDVDSSNPVVCLDTV